MTMGDVLVRLSTADELEWMRYGWLYVDFCLVGVEVPCSLDKDDLRDRECSKGPSSDCPNIVGSEAECGMMGLADGDPVTPRGARYPPSDPPTLELGDPIGMSLENDDDRYRARGDIVSIKGSGCRRGVAIMVGCCSVSYVGFSN